jgi:hypothetical protein
VRFLQIASLVVMIFLLFIYAKGLIRAGKISSNVSLENSAHLMI